MPVNFRLLSGLPYLRDAFIKLDDVALAVPAATVVRYHSR